MKDAYRHICFQGKLKDRFDTRGVEVNVKRWKKKTLVKWRAWQFLLEFSGADKLTHCGEKFSHSSFWFLLRVLRHLSPLCPSPYRHTGTPTSSAINMSGHKHPNHADILVDQASLICFNLLRFLSYNLSHIHSAIQLVVNCLFQMNATCSWQVYVYCTVIQSRSLF